jgi:hypothetical protein
VQPLATVEGNLGWAHKKIQLRKSTYIEDMRMQALEELCEFLF